MVEGTQRFLQLLANLFVLLSPNSLLCNVATRSLVLKHHVERCCDASFFDVACNCNSVHLWSAEEKISIFVGISVVIEVDCSVFSEQGIEKTRCSKHVR